MLRFENEKAIVMVRGHKPLIVEKVDISELKESKQLTIRAIKDYLRPWAAEVTGNTTAGQVCDAGAQSQINADQSQNRFTTPPENNADGSEGNEQKETGEDELL